MTGQTVGPLSHHASTRVAERAGVTADAFLAEARDHAVKVMIASPTQHFWLVWLRGARRLLPFLTDPSTGESVVTVLPCPGSRRHPTFLPDPALPSGGRFVQRSMAEAAMRAAGVDPETMRRVIADAFPPRPPAAGSTRAADRPYQWTLRYLTMDFDGAIRPHTQTLGRVTSTDPLPPDETIARATGIVDAANGWEARLDLTVHKGRRFIGEVTLEAACHAWSTHGKRPAEVAASGSFAN